MYPSTRDRRRSKHVHKHAGGNSRRRHEHVHAVADCDNRESGSLPPSDMSWKSRRFLHILSQLFVQKYPMNCQYKPLVSVRVVDVSLLWEFWWQIPFHLLKIDVLIWLL